ncbi:ABC transporter A family member 3 [Acorus calamus]|uniref:ABC transporter A family member 3 n=1 Tax=Acorus calamus TaxID=4465 RepID=A0AAV9DFN9_ACOCL|nr:ABC transporter A family member 3 [Acorus calamus]
MVKEAIKESVKKVNLHDKEYSGGMKRRLSVAISLIGNPHVTGLLQPTSGNAFVNSIDTRSKTNQIYTSIGMCPQKDVLWESLTGREHLLFYGRLRKLAGTKLQQAVDESLRSLKLYDGNVADRLAGKYSVAISLIGDTQVVFLDEPTTGLDPESRNHLWKLKSRYGKSYQLTMSADPAFEKDVERMVNNISPNVVKTYEVSGTQKFQIPKRDAAKESRYDKEAVIKFFRMSKYGDLRESEFCMGWTARSECPAIVGVLEIQEESVLPNYHVRKNLYG